FIRKNFFNTFHRLFNLSLTGGIGEPDAVGTSKGITCNRSYQGFFQKKHREIVSIIYLMSLNRFSEEIGNVREDVESTFWFRYHKAFNFVHQVDDQFPSLFKTIDHILYAMHRSFQGSNYRTLRNTVGATGDLALHLITGPGNLCGGAYISDPPTRHGESF